MARKDSFNKTWASNPAQFEKPGDALIERGWAGGASEDPPEAKWENWWHNRLDEALLEIQNSGALAWFSDAKYTKGALVNYGGKNWVALSANSNISPNGSLDNGIWLEVEYSKSDFLKKSQNGADIPDKNAFVKNLGLVETVNKANNAVPNSRKVNGKALSGDVSLNAGDVGSYSRQESDENFLRKHGTAYVSFLHIDAKNKWPGMWLHSSDGYQIGIEGTVGRMLTIWANDDDGNRRYNLLTPEKSGTLATTDDINVPVGVPLPYPHRYTPPGYLTCNGQTFDKSLYPKLAEAYPDGRVPDLRGEFIRGWDDSRGVDPGRVCGTWQADSTKRIQLAEGNADSRYMSPNQGPVNGYWYPLGRDVKGNATDTSIANNTGGNETRPRNIAFNYIVRAA
ncbi:phage tail protein [Photorhabdus namnaonensis]|uniref:Phage Tail Collar Domain protein n=1 Tax=Photorhabdus namnaonensis TaxID=1851568 RepID=A0A1B8YFY7_9GAMM|nr:phage tail protein [Photorhabdus namnaonensis]OCA53962.1 Phage Tail Collar Domain protein [Photorhabdus namnaonensis]